MAGGGGFAVRVINDPAKALMRFCNGTNPFLQKSQVKIERLQIRSSRSFRKNRKRYAGQSYAATQTKRRLAEQFVIQELGVKSNKLKPIW